MKRRVQRVLVLAVGMLMQVGVAYAYKTETIVKAENKDDFTAVAAAVHQQMAPGPAGSTIQEWALNRAVPELPPIPRAHGARGP